MSRVACIVIGAVIGGRCGAPMAREVPVPVRVTTPTTAATCADAPFRALLAQRERAWLADVHARARPVIVVDVRGERVVIADVVASAIVTRTVARDALGRAVIAAAPMSATAGGAPEPGIVVQPGFPITTRRDGAHVGGDVGVTLDGFVPASAVGAVWTAGDARDRGRALGVAGAVFDAPGGRQIATLAAPTRGTVLALQATWVRVRATAEHAIVEGWLARPAPAPDTPTTGNDASDAGDAALPDDGASGACLYDAPGGRAIGVVLAPTDPPRAFAAVPSAPGWVRFTLAAAWGETIVYARTPIAPPPEPDAVDWKFGNGSQW